MFCYLPSCCRKRVCHESVGINTLPVRLVSEVLSLKSRLPECVIALAGSKCCRVPLRLSTSQALDWAILLTVTMTLLAVAKSKARWREIWSTCGTHFIVFQFRGSLFVVPEVLSLRA
jgi:hypothetical protein